SMSMIAETCAFVGDETLARQLYDVLLPYRGLQVIDGIGAANYGSVERYLGMLAAVAGDSGVASAHFVAGREVHDRSRARALVDVTTRDAALFSIAQPAPLRADA